MNKEMRIMYLFRAMPGSGKSTIIKDYELQSNTLSFDTFRELLSGQTVGLNGQVGIEQKYNDMVASFFREALKIRMKERSVIIVDNLNAKVSEINSYHKIAKLNGYTVKVVNFELKDIEFYFERNKGRSERKSLGKESIERLYNVFKNTNLKECIPEIISVKDFTKEITNTVDDLAVDLSKYNKIHHVGDILGTSKPLTNVLDSFNDNDFYIFVGNYFDLGKTPDKVASLLKDIYLKDNVVFLRGNYDNKLSYFINDNEVNDDLFNDITKDKITKHKSFIKEFYYNQKDYYIYSYNDENVFVSNAGVTNVPKKPYLINTSVFTEGVGSNVFDVGYCFDKNASRMWKQVHGYRNFKGKREENIDVKSFSLASDVAVGGYLTELILDKEGFKTFEYKSDDFHPIVKKTYDKQFFKTFKDSEEIDLSKATKVERKNATMLHSFSDYKVYTINNTIVNIFNDNVEKPIILRKENVEKVFISSNNDETFVLDSDFNLIKDINVPKEIEALTKKFNAIASCSICDGKFSILEFFHKDKNKNELKTSLYNDFNVKNDMLYFNNINALEGFLKSIKNGKNKKYSSNLIIEYPSGKKSLFVINNKSLKIKNK